MENKDLKAKSVYLCEQYRRQGFACSESVCRALADIYEICLSEEIHKVISVFAGGAIDDGRCGIIEAGLLITSLLYDSGRISEDISLEKISVEMHRRFEEKYGGYGCKNIFYPLYEQHQKSGLPESEFHCVFHEGIVIIIELLNQMTKERKEAK